jgi:NDP-sugar pyrophosphorylase family protein
VFPCSAEFHDIGTPADYFDTSLQLAASGAGDLEPGAGTRIDPTARVERTLLWNGVTVGAGARLRDCIVTDGVHVPEGMAWERVTIRAVRADGPLAGDERRIRDLAVAPF